MKFGNIWLSERKGAFLWWGEGGSQLKLGAMLALHVFYTKDGEEGGSQLKLGAMIVLHVFYTKDDVPLIHPTTA